MKFIEHGSPALVLAPMEGVTDAPMRALMTARGGFTYCVSEFVRVSGEPLRADRFLQSVPELKTGARTLSGVLVQIQILGGDAGRLAESAAQACVAGSPGVDLNFGCPAPTVNKHDGGATLLKNPKRIREIVSAVRAAVPAALPVSAKLRLGFDSIDEIFANAEMAAEGGASWLTIHARTKAQGYAPPAWWGHVGEVRKRLSIPVVANGEIWSTGDFRRCLEETGCEHFMVGRGALANPNLALEIEALLADRAPGFEPWEDRKDQWTPVFAEFIERCLAYSGNPRYALRRVKQWMSLVAFRRQVPWFEPLKRVQTLDEMIEGLMVGLPAYESTVNSLVLQDLS